MSLSIKDRFILALIKKARHPDDPEPSGEPYEMEPATRVGFLFDCIKLLGTGNGAGAVASVAGTYYFAATPAIQGWLKACSIAFFIGLIVFAVSVTAFIVGIVGASDFGTRIKGRDPNDVPTRIYEKAGNVIIALAVSAVATFICLACFVAGVSIALFAVIIR